MNKTTLLSLITCCMIVFSCQPSLKIKDGQTAFKTKRYLQAAELFQEELAKSNIDFEKGKLSYQIAESYRLANKIEDAASWYSKSLGFGYDEPETIWNYARMLQQQEKYDDAIRQFNIYATQYSFDRSIASQYIQACEDAKMWKDNPEPIDVISAEAVNTAGSDFAPVINNGKLVFTSSRSDATGDVIYQWTKEDYCDIYTSELNESGEGTPTSMNELINTSFHEGTVAFNSDGSEMIFSRCGSDGDKNDYCALYSSKKGSDGNWLAPSKLYLFDEFANIGHPALSADGSRLYFSSDVSRGYGGRDLYFANRSGAGWGLPVNLGASVNTSKDEVYPTIFGEDMLLFSSNGHLGMGGLDIFSANLIEQKWTNVQNVRAPINSGADDFGITFYPNDIERGYFSSTRSGGMGSDDIYAFQVTDVDLDGLVDDRPISYFLDITVLENTYQDNDPNLSITGQQPLEQAEISAIGIEIDIVLERTSGKDLEIIPIDEGDYRLVFNKSGYFSQTEIVSTKNRMVDENREVHVPITVILEPIVAEKEIVIDNIYYDLDQSDIRPDAALELNKLVALLQQNPNVNIEIGAHTDSQGTDSYNLDLSARRAASVVSYLIDNGVDGARLTSRGYGETQLVNNCTNGVECSDEEHEQNRRTTFKVVGNN